MQEIGRPLEAEIERLRAEADRRVEQLTDELGLARAENERLTARTEQVERDRDTFRELYARAIQRAELELMPEIERLRTALEPFARQITAIECTTDHQYRDDETWPVDEDQVVKIGDLRRARAALERNGEKP